MRTMCYVFLCLISASILFGQLYDLKVKMKNGCSTCIPIDKSTKIVFSITSAVNVDDLKKRDTPESFTLQQNYPNPFNPTTMIQYQLPEPGKVEIQIFDMAGKCIKTLFSGFQEKGYKSISWDSRDEKNNQAASGAYLYQIKFNNLIVNKKMLLIK